MTSYIKPPSPTVNTYQIPVHKGFHSHLYYNTHTPTRTMRFLHSVARLYNTNFDRRPVATLVVTNGVLNTIADVLVSFPDIHHPFFLSSFIPLI